MGRRTIEERFWSRVDKSDADGCWFWLGTINNKGYGSIRFEGKTYGSHVISFFLEHGRFPETCGLHKCDNPLCVRPDHIFEGTKKDNTVDMMNKGRHKHGTGNTGKKGSSSSRARFTDEQVRDMRNMLKNGATLQVVADKYNAHKAYISLIKRGLRWAHI